MNICIFLRGVLGIFGILGDIRDIGQIFGILGGGYSDYWDIRGILGYWEDIREIMIY